jgi:hypothetical protein
MVYLAALAIFLLITVVVWFTAVALYHLLAGGPDLRQGRHFAAASAVSVLLVTLFSFVPFPAGYLLALVVWWLAARNFLQLPLARALILFLLLAALSFVGRLAVLGVLNF